MLRDHEEPHGHHVVILPLVVGAGSISLWGRSPQICTVRHGVTLKS